MRLRRDGPDSLMMTNANPTIRELDGKGTSGSASSARSAT